MLIKKLILHHCHRLHLLEDQSFEYDFTQKHTILDGVNGAGKSSIFNELSPLPANMDDYLADGYKKIVIEHNNSEYILTSQGKRPGKHSFLKDGEELNPGGTLTVQYELVENFFNYTPAYHRVLQGKLLFTEMSAKERRDWFADISGMDSDFVMKFWDKIRAGQRDNTGALKNIKNKIAEANLQLLDDKEIGEVEEKLSDIIKLFNGLTDLLKQFPRSEVQTAPVEYNEDIAQRVKHLYFKYLKESEGIGGVNLTERYQLQSELLEQDRVQMNDLQEQLVKLTDEKHRFDFNSEDNIEELERRYDEYRARLASFDQSTIDQYKVILQYPYFSRGDGLTQVYQTYNNQLRYVDDALLAFQPFSLPYRQAKEQVNYKSSELMKLQGEQQGVQFKIGEIDKQLQHLNQHPETQCPNCYHRFKEGNVDAEIQRLSLVRSQLIQRDNELTATVDTLTKEVEFEQANLKNYEMILLTVTSDEHGLSEYLKATMTNDGSLGTLMRLIHDNPKAYLGAFQQQIAKIPTYIEVGKVLTELEGLAALIQKGKAQASPEYIQLVGRIEQLTQLHDEASFRYHKRRALVEKIYNAIELQRKFTEQLDKVNQLVEHQSNFIKDETTKLFHLEVSEVLAKLKMEIDECQDRIQHQAGIKFVIRSHEENRSGIEKSINIHTQLMQILDPKTGLIAKSVIGFIRHFVKEMNNLMSQVWTYPIIIDIESEDDFTKKYLFPVVIGEDAIRRDDVYETSLGQTELINFIFRITLVKYLNLENYPLYLDEVGGHLSVQHRNRLYNLIKRMVDHHYFSQVFMVTHLQDVKVIMEPAETILLK